MMKNFAKFTPAAAALLALGLGACAAGGSGKQDTAAQAGQVRQGASERFECRNGLVVLVSQAGTERVSLAVENQTAPVTMTAAPSGSGERYVASAGLYGGGGEWHRKGNEAVFSYAQVHGGTGQTECAKM